MQAANRSETAQVMSAIPDLSYRRKAANFTQWRAAHPELHCPGLRSPWAGHAPVQKHEMNSRMLVGVFRRPSQRLLSGFHHREHGEADSMIAPGAPPERRAVGRR